MRTIAQHALTTYRTTEQVEALDTAETPMIWRTSNPDLYAQGDYVIVTSADGDIFLGTIVDEQTEREGRIYVELN